MVQRLPLRWVDNLKNQKDKDSFFETLTNSRFILGRLKTILIEDLEALERLEGLDFDSPAWPYKQAELIGQKKQLKKALTLLSFL